MKKTLFIIILFIFSSQITFSQNDPFFTNYAVDPIYYNAAYIGKQTDAVITLQSRSQWLGYQATVDTDNTTLPNTQLLSFTLPVEKIISNTGVIIINDKVANISDLQVRFPIVTETKLIFDRSFVDRLFVGIVPAFNIKSLKNNFRPVDGDDDLIPTGNVAQLKFNLHASVYFETKNNFFGGFSVDNIFTPSFNFNTPASNKLRRLYLFLAGSERKIYRNFTIRSSLLVKSDFVSHAFEVSVLGTYNKKWWVGASFRRSKAVSLLFGYSFLENNKLKVGYSLDYILQNQIISNRQITSHELYLTYMLKDILFGSRKVIKTPRFPF